MDGWNHPFRYECWASEGSDKCDHYAVGSAGRDGTFEHPTLREYKLVGTGTKTTNYDNDLVYSDGEFVEYPEY